MLILGVDVLQLSEVLELLLVFILVDAKVVLEFSEGVDVGFKCHLMDLLEDNMGLYLLDVVVETVWSKAFLNDIDDLPCLFVLTPVEWYGIKLDSTCDWFLISFLILQLAISSIVFLVEVLNDLEVAFVV